MYRCSDAFSKNVCGLERARKAWKECNDIDNCMIEARFGSADTVFRV